MELPAHTWSEAAFNLLSANRARVQLPTAYRCFMVFRQSLKKSWVHESFATPSSTVPLSLKVAKLPALRTFSASLQPADRPSSRTKGKRHKSTSASSSSISNSASDSRNKEAALAGEESRHSYSSGSPKRSTKLTSSKTGSSTSLTSRSSSKDNFARASSNKRASSTETHSNLVIFSESCANTVSRLEIAGIQVRSKTNSDKKSADPGLFEKSRAKSVLPKECAAHKELCLHESHNREAYHATLSLAELGEEKAREFEELKIQQAVMAEANGFRFSKRSKKNPEEAKLSSMLNLCSKHGNLRGALDVYDTLKKTENFNMKQHHYNVLLYICSGAASGSISTRKSRKDEKGSAAILNEDGKGTLVGTEESTNQVLKGEGEDAHDLDMVSFGPEDRQLAAKRGTEVYEDMLQAKIPANEATFTSVARLAVAKGDGDMAFETVKKMTAANIIPKLRSYGPALLCFCESNQAEKVFEVDDHMVAGGILPDETLLEAMLKVSVAGGIDEKIYSLLQRLRTTVRDVSPATVTTIEKWFNSKAAAAAGKAKWDKLSSKEEIRKAAEAGGGGWHGLGWLGKGTWTTKRTNISKSGVCLNCGETLCTIDLDPEETDKFAKSVAELAMQRENNSQEFLAFQEWLKEKGPFEAVLDGANIGMYNSALRGFNYNQVATVANAVKARNLTEKSPLIVLHRRRTLDGAPRSPRSGKMIEGWINDNALYSTPHGSNDDWYWLYAAVSNKCLLVTNDEMRDHLFELLGNNFFPKWKERHQVRFTFSANGLEVLKPPPYSTVLQESQNGGWHIPQAGGDDIECPREWLCVTRSQRRDVSSSYSPTRLECEPANRRVAADGDCVKDPNTSCLSRTGGDAPSPVR